MQVEHWRSERLQEEMVIGRWETGLQAFVLPKPGFSKQYAVFSTRYGSMDRRFRHPDTGQILEVPDGIAHFLEHKLFEEEDGNIFDRFAELGASANAYTSYTMTSYLFSCSENFYENLDVLLGFVQRPHFTDDNVEKEKGIIEQEIRMYQDQAGHRIMRNLLEALYHENPVRIDILGTVDSIYRIDKDILYRCHETFYHPSNMALFVVGDVDPQRVLEQVDRDMSRRGYRARPPIQRFYPQEPQPVNRPRVEDRLNVSRPRYALGFKDDVSGLEGRELLRREVVTGLLLATVFGKSTAFYQRLYEEGLIDDHFGARYSCSPYFGFTVIGGETRDPEALDEALRQEIQRVRSQGLDPDDIRRLQRREMGDFLRVFNSLEFIANGFLHYHFKGTSLLDYLDVLDEVDVAAVEERLQEHLDLERSAVSIIRPTRDRSAGEAR